MPLVKDILRYSDSDILEIIKEQKSYSEQFYKGRLSKRMRENWKRYKVEPVTEAYKKPENVGEPGHPESSARSNLQCPWVRIIVDTVAATIKQMMFPDSTSWLGTRSVNKDLTQEQLNAAKQYMLSRCAPYTDQINLIEHVNEFILYGLIFDYSIMTASWLQHGGYVRDYPFDVKRKMNPNQGILQWANLVFGQFAERLGEMLKPAFKKTSPSWEDMNEGFKWVDPIVRRPAIDIPHPLNCIIDPQAHREVSSWGFFGTRGRLFYGDIQRQAISADNPYGNYYNLGAMEELIRSGEADTETLYDQIRAEVEGENIAKGNAQNDAGGNRERQVKEYDRIANITWYTQEALIVCDWDCRVIIRKQRMDRIPAVCWAYSRDTNTIAGDSLVTILDPFNEMVNHLVNSRIDNLNLSINLVPIINKDGMAVQRKTYKIISGLPMIIKGNKTPRDVIDVLKFPDVTQAVREEIQFIVGFMERLSGAGNAQQGVHRVAGERTAYENLLVQQGSELRFHDVVHECERPTHRLLALIAELDLFYMDEMRIAMFLGTGQERWVTISRDLFLEFAPFVEYVLQGSRVAIDRIQKHSMIMNQLKLAGTNPQMNKLTNYREGLRELYRQAGEENPDRFLNANDKAMFTVPPELEHTMMAHGLFYRPGWLDDDLDHMEKHTELIAKVEAGEAKDFPTRYLPLLYAHVQLQEAQMQEKMMPPPIPGMQPGAEGEQVPGRDQLAGITPTEMASNTTLNPNAAVPANNAPQAQP